MKVLLSIKPEFAYKIFSGEKKYEFRRMVFKSPEVKKIVVYASSPVQRVIGEIEIDHIIEDYIEPLWEHTMSYSGIEKRFFNDYFCGKEKGFAIKIKKTKKYKRDKLLSDFGINYAPQSFIYLNS